MTICKNCGKPLKWFKDPVNEKWIPLEADCDLEYENPEEVNTEKTQMRCNANMQQGLWNPNLF